MTVIRNVSSLRPLAVVALVGMLFLAGCADNPNQASGNTDSNSNAEVAGEGIEGAKDFLAKVSVEDEAAEADLVPDEAPPAAKDKTVVVVQNGAGAEGAARAAEGMKAAGAALGWNVKVVDGQFNPNVQGQAVLSALSSKADGIVLDSIAPETIGGPVSRALNQNIPVVTTAVPNSPETTPGIFADVSNSSYDGGLALAAWVAVKSNGTANIVNVPDTSLTLTQLRAQGVSDGLEKFCPDCPIVEEQQNDIANMPTRLPSLMSSAVQKHGTDNVYVIAPFDSAVPFMIQGLKDAGADYVPIVSMDGNKQAIDQIRSKDFLAATWAGAWEWVGWGAIDQLNRAFAGEEPVEQSAPSLLVDESNLPPAGTSWTPAFDYEAAYKEIWGV